MYVIIALFVAFLWGIQPIIYKHLLQSIDLKTIVAIGSFFYSICASLFGIYYWKDIERGLKKIDMKSVGLIGASTICAAFLANILILYVLKDNSCAVVSALIYSAPIFTLLFAYLFINEKISFASIAGIVMIVSGVVLISCG
jgi:drug/metabolite transporter (DMT)-like permease